MGEEYPKKTVWTTMHAHGHKCRCGASLDYILEKEDKLKCSVCGKTWWREKNKISL